MKNEKLKKKEQLSLRRNEIFFFRKMRLEKAGKEQ